MIATSLADLIFRGIQKKGRSVRVMICQTCSFHIFDSQTYVVVEQEFGKDLSALSRSTLHDNCFPIAPLWKVNPSHHIFDNPYKLGNHDHHDQYHHDQSCHLVTRDGSLWVRFVWVFDVLFVDCLHHYAERGPQTCFAGFETHLTLDFLQMYPPKVISFAKLQPTCQR